MVISGYKLTEFKLPVRQDIAKPGNSGMKGNRLTHDDKDILVVNGHWGHIHDIIQLLTFLTYMTYLTYLTYMTYYDLFNLYDLL